MRLQNWHRLLTVHTGELSAVIDERLGVVLSADREQDYSVVQNQTREWHEAARDEMWNAVCAYRQAQRKLRAARYLRQEAGAEDFELQNATDFERRIVAICLREATYALRHAIHSLGIRSTHDLARLMEPNPRRAG